MKHINLQLFGLEATEAGDKKTAALVKQILEDSRELMPTTKGKYY